MSLLLSCPGFTFLRQESIELGSEVYISIPLFVLAATVSDFSKSLVIQNELQQFGVRPWPICLMPPAWVLHENCIKKINKSSLFKPELLTFIVWSLLSFFQCCRYMHPFFLPPTPARFKEKVLVMKWSQWTYFLTSCQYIGWAFWN